MSERFTKFEEQPYARVRYQLPIASLVVWIISVLILVARHVNITAREAERLAN